MNARIDSNAGSRTGKPVTITWPEFPEIFPARRSGSNCHCHVASTHCVPWMSFFENKKNVKEFDNNPVSENGFAF